METLSPTKVLNSVSQWISSSEILLPSHSPHFSIEVTTQTLKIYLKAWEKNKNKKTPPQNPNHILALRQVCILSWYHLGGLKNLKLKIYCGSKLVMPQAEIMKTLSGGTYLYLNVNEFHKVLRDM